MAAFPPLAQIAGPHIGVFEAYYKQADPNGTGSIGALDAATFLKKSGLKDTVLSQIWDLSDPTGKGYLEKPGFFTALKMVSLAQASLEMNMSKITSEAPVPNLGPVEVKAEASPSHSAAGGQWALSANEKANYDQVFDSLQPVNGLLAGDKVRPVLMNSKLPVDILGRIWDMSDIDKDGFLDREEFAVAMHLVYKSLEKEPLPSALTPLLIPPSKRKGIAGGVPVLTPGVIGGRSTPTQRSDSPSVAVPWVVTPAEKSNFDVMFKKADLDMDGFVSGQEIRDIFLQSGLPNTVLAHIWALCDTKSIGKLNSEQFALAIYLIQKKLKGIEPPAQLTPEMMPPSMRPKTNADPTAFGVTVDKMEDVPDEPFVEDGTNAGPYSHVADFSAIKELDVISKDIDDMKREKSQLERDNAQREADIKICNGEVQMLQKELDAITATLQQLESQKKEAQKKLDELDDKKSDLQSSVKELKEKCEGEQKQIESLRQQINNQEKSVKNQEEDLNKLRVDLGNLRDEETQLEQKVETGKQQLESLIKSQKDLQVQTSQTKTRVQHMEDQQRAMRQSIASYGGQVNGEVTSILSGLQVEDQLSSRATYGSSPVSSVSSFSTGSVMDDFKEDPFKSKDPFGGSDTGQADPFQSEDPFKGSDPFKADGFTSDPFASDDPFKDAFSGGTATTTTTSKDDPFSSMDPFGGSNFSSSQASSSKKIDDAFDPFGGGSKSQSKSGDLFGSDPFAPKEATSGTTSPSPALPPKQKKQPPPRPAPPKGRPTPSPTPTKPVVDPFPGFGSDPFAGNDPFASSGGNNSSTGGDAFANFADFSPSKFEEDKAWGTS